MNRNPDKHEYEVQSGSNHASRMIYAGTTEQAAKRKATKLMAGVLDGEAHVRLYHTHPSPGPVRRYVGTIDKTGTLTRAS